MVDIQEVIHEVESTHTTDSEQYLSDELRASITTLYQQFVERARNSKITELRDAIQLAEAIPTVRFIAELESVEGSLITAKMDRRFIGTLLQLYANLAEELDRKLVNIVNGLGNQASLVFDRLADAGYGAFGRFEWYFYDNASELRQNKYIRYQLFWIAFTRYLHLAAAFFFGGHLLLDQYFGKLPGLDGKLSVHLKIFSAIIVSWSLIAVCIPEFIYGTFSDNFLSRYFRRLFTGAVTSAPEEEIKQKFDSFLEVKKNILSVRMQLRTQLREMLRLAQTGEFKTHYWSIITFDELTDALSRGGQLDYKDRNVLLILLGFSQILPLLSNPNFMIEVAPLVWRRYGYGLVAASITTIILNLWIFEYLRSIPLATILLEL